MKATFEEEVLGEVKNLREEVSNNIDRTDAATKAQFEALTKVQNDRNASHEEKLLEIQKSILALKREEKSFGLTGIEKITRNPEKLARLTTNLYRGMNVEMPEHIKESLGITGKAAVTEDSTPGSTFILDKDIIADVYSTLLTYGVYPNFDLRSFKTKVSKFPVQTARSVAQWKLAQTGTFSPDATKAGTSVDVTMQLLGDLIPVSLELLQDGEIDVAQDVLNDMFEALAFGIDSACLTGNGTADANNGGFTGIFVGGTTCAAATTHTSVSKYTLADFSKATVTVDAGVLGKNPAWIMHPQTLAKCINVVDGNGRPLFLNAMQAPDIGGIGSILGYRVIVAGAAPVADTVSSTTIAFGDPKALGCGMRAGVELDYSDHALWTAYQRSFRGTVRFGSAIKKATAFAILTSAAS